MKFHIENVSWLYLSNVQYVYLYITNIYATLYKNFIIRNVLKSNRKNFAAANDYFQEGQHLIEQGEADPTIGHSNGRNALHLAASYNRMSTDVIRFLLEHISIDSINQKLSGSRVTPLDQAYQYNFSPIREEIIALISYVKKAEKQIIGMQTVD